MNDRGKSYVGHRGRLKEKYRSAGIDGWHDYEVLELILTYALPRKDTKPLSRALLHHFKTINAVLETDTARLCEIPGISEHSALLLRLFRDVARRTLRAELEGRDLLSSPQAVADYLRSALGNSAVEEFHALYLDAANRLIKTERLQTGTVNRAAVYPRIVAERALRCHAVSCIIAHNHPAGTCTPSPEDRTVTEAVKRALETVEIGLLDHVLVTRAGHFSWKEKELL